MNIRTLTGALSLMLAMAMAVAVGSALANGTTVAYVGQGFNFDGTTYNLNDERCGLTGQNDANDGGTGQFANWNGEGMPYETGQGYLVWVLTANGAAGATLHLPDQSVAMIAVGGTFKYASQYYNVSNLIPPAETAVTAHYTGTVKGKVQLVVSHGCQPFEAEGAWCSPGYWRNAQDAAWALIGVDRTNALFNGNVSSNFYANDLNPDRTLTFVLNNPNQFGGQLGTAGPYGLTAFNAVGAYLTDQIPGFFFDPLLIGQENACPIDNHGNFKQP